MGQESFLAASIESLQSELSAYKSTCGQLDVRVKSLTQTLALERDRFKLRISELENTRTLLDCPHCGVSLDPKESNTMKPIGSETFGNTVMPRQRASLEAQWEKNGLASVLDDRVDPQPETSIQSIHKSESKNLIFEGPRTITDVKWLDMEQKPNAAATWIPAGQEPSLPQEDIKLEESGFADLHDEFAASLVGSLLEPTERDVGQTQSTPKNKGIASTSSFTPTEPDSDAGFMPHISSSPEPFSSSTFRSDVVNPTLGIQENISRVLEAPASLIVDDSTLFRNRQLFEQGLPVSHARPTSEMPVRPKIEHEAEHRYSLLSGTSQGLTQSFQPVTMHVDQVTPAFDPFKPEILKEDVAVPLASLDEYDSEVDLNNQESYVPPPQLPQTVRKTLPSPAPPAPKARKASEPALTFKRPPSIMDRRTTIDASARGFKGFLGANVQSMREITASLLPSVMQLAEETRQETFESRETPVRFVKF